MNISERNKQIAEMDLRWKEYEKYAMFISVVRNRTDFVENTLKRIDQNPKREIFYKSSDVAKELFPTKTLTEDNIYLGLKFALFIEGIDITSTRLKEIDTITGKQYLVLKLRRVIPCVPY